MRGVCAWCVWVWMWVSVPLLCVCGLGKGEVEGSLELPLEFGPFPLQSFV